MKKKQKTKKESFISLLPMSLSKKSKDQPLKKIFKSMLDG